MKNLTKLIEKELIEIDGGSFAFDVGWFIANGLAGNFNNPYNTVEALVDYNLHYSK